MKRQNLPFWHLMAALAISAWAMATQPAAAADISALLARAAAADKGGDPVATIKALEEALETVRAAAPLIVRPFVLVTQPAKFYGDFVPRADAVFRGGGAQQFYMEPKNLVYPRTATGTYVPAFEVDLRILTAAGKVLVSQDRFGSFRLPTKSAVQDIYLNLKVTLSGAPPGQYSVRFVVRDLNSKKAATVTQPITLK